LIRKNYAFVQKSYARAHSFLLFLTSGSQQASLNGGSTSNLQKKYSQKSGKKIRYYS